MLQSVTEYYRVLQSVTECYRVLQSINLAHLLGPIFGLVSHIERAYLRCFLIIVPITLKLFGEKIVNIVIPITS